MSAQYTDSDRLDWMIQQNAMVTEGMSVCGDRLHIGFIVVTPLDDKQLAMPMDSARSAIDAAMSGAEMVNAEPAGQDDPELSDIIARIAYGSGEEMHDAIWDLRGYLSEDDEVPYAV